MQIKIIILILVLSFSGCSQQEDKPEEEIIVNNLLPEKNTEAEINQNGFPVCQTYFDHFPNIKGNHPVYNSSFVDSIVYNHTKNQNVKYDIFRHIDYFDEIEIQNLPITDFIYYCIQFPATFHQICSVPHYPRGNGKLIFGYVPFSIRDSRLSSIQTNELKRRRKEVIEFLSKYLLKHPDELSRTYVELMLEIDAVEMFPLVIKYANPNSLINYTFLLEIMNHHNYPKLMENKMYHQLYGDHVSRFDSYIISTEENRYEIIRLAKMFYENEKSK